LVKLRYVSFGYDTGGGVGAEWHYSAAVKKESGVGGESVVVGRGPQGDG
jgi:hypothetical protein